MALKLKRKKERTSIQLEAIERFRAKLESAKRVGTEIVVVEGYS